MCSLFESFWCEDMIRSAHSSSTRGLNLPAALVLAPAYPSISAHPRLCILDPYIQKTFQYSPSSIQRYHLGPKVEYFNLGRLRRKNCRFALNNQDCVFDAPVSRSVPSRDIPRFAKPFAQSVSPHGFMGAREAFVNGSLFQLLISAIRGTVPAFLYQKKSLQQTPCRNIGHQP